jgi:hypothetical protein
LSWSSVLERLTPGRWVRGEDEIEKEKERGKGEMGRWLDEEKENRKERERGRRQTELIQNLW